MLGFSATLLYTFGRARFLTIQDSLFEAVEPTSTTQTIGVELMTNYVLPFEVSGVLLMAVLIGAAYLSTKTKN
jgi:NADH-quinone oxidoreductase subunit J